ncbi:6-bladed beta-propeller [bacterium]|nr:MAG: 6-bladed beta-propeller [bacterium]
MFMLRVMRMIMNGRTCGAIFLAITALVGSCETLPVRVVPGRDAITPSFVWPQPPERPRIRFVRVVARPQDLGIESSFWQRVWGVLVGKEEEWFIRPTSVAANGQAIFVTDAGGQALWILNPQAGRFHKIQEAGGQKLISPVSVARGPHNRIYLADSYLGKIFVYDREEKFLDTISHPDFRRPAGLAYDAVRDRLYVADSAAHRIWIFAADGKPLGAIGQRGNGNGEFNFPTHVAVDRAGRLYVTDALNFRLQMFNEDGSLSGLFGSHGDSSGDFASPKGVAVDSEGNIYVVDALFDAVQIFDRSGQYLLTLGERGLGPGQFWLPGGIFIDDRDQIYVADAYNQRIQIFQYLAGGGAK